MRTIRSLCSMPMDSYQIRMLMYLAAILRLLLIDMGLLHKRLKPNIL